MYTRARRKRRRRQRYKSEAAAARCHRSLAYIKLTGITTKLTLFRSKAATMEEFCKDDLQPPVTHPASLLLQSKLHSLHSFIQSLQF